jgi:hypothetical protein
LLSRPIVMPSRLELHHTNVHRFGTSPVCQRTGNAQPPASNINHNFVRNCYFIKRFCLTK